jgi:hypothetical protein
LTPFADFLEVLIRKMVGGRLLGDLAKIALEAAMTVNTDLDYSSGQPDNPLRW